MKFVKTLKILLILLLLLIVLLLFGLGVAWWSLREGWPWWVPLAVTAGLLGLICTTILGKRLLLARRSKAQISRLIENTVSAPLDSGADSRLSNEHSLRNHWEESVVHLKQSELKRQGNPLKVVPWFLMLGESRVGKTTAVKNALVSSPLTRIDAQAQARGTKNCDWWYCDQAVILDTAGRYSVPLDGNRDQEEWKVLLELLGRQRHRPVKGVVVCISADQLLQCKDVVLGHKGRLIRQRLNHLMELLGNRFPVYLLVTKMDLVHGFSDFFAHFTSSQIESAMGWANSQPAHDWKMVMDETFFSLTERLRRLRLILAHRVDLRLCPGAVLFPSEFGSLEQGLQNFAAGVFGFDRYLESPFLRGIYFSSGLCEGQPSSTFLDTIGRRVASGVPAGAAPE